MSSIDGFASYTRHLPHWRMKGAAYFVTWRLANGHPDLTVEEREIVASPWLGRHLLRVPECDARFTASN